MKEHPLTRRSNLVKGRIDRVRDYAKLRNTMPYGMREPTRREKEAQADERKMQELFGGL